ncbi:Cof-type HAD-IIB family hydrolase [Streptococcaceae bacterium ESL0729]|nr:Cof-type HAD-IIB family hydrolase [Streptococcaceae bacterium ESL0729]
MIKLVATDMDGTFLKEDGSFDKKRLGHVLEEFKNQGIIFAAASGRQLASLKDLFSDFTDQVAFIAENGSIVEYGGEILYENKMNPDEYKKITKILANHPHVNRDSISLSGKESAYILESADDEIISHFKKYYSNVKLIDNFDDLKDDVLKVMVTFPREHVLNAQDWVNERIKPYRGVTTGFESIDIMAGHVNKALGLSHLAEKLNIDPADMAAFGDNLNDLEMLSYVGHSYATENARDEVKDICKYQIGHCNDEATIGQIEKLVNL